MPSPAAFARFLFGVVATLHYGPIVQAQPTVPPPTQYRDAIRLLDYWLEAQTAFDRVPAVSAGVVIGQELVWSRGYGFVDESRKIPAGSDTIYSVCSISKLFTSIAVMQLWEAGRFSLDDDIGKLLPSAKIERSDPDSGPISIRALLTHSSGLPRETLTASWPPTTYLAPSTAQLLNDLPRQSTFMRSSDHYQYSNLGMVLLGEVVATISAQPFSQVVQERILFPLKLVDTRPWLPIEMVGSRLPRGYSALKRDGTRDPLPPYHANGLAAVAGFPSTVNDLARFAAWQFRLNKNGGTEVLRVATLRDMQRVQWTDPDGKSTWGLGFAVSREGANTVASHSGRCPGYETAIALALKDEVAVISLANANGGGPYTRQMRQLVLKGLRLPAATAGEGVPDLEAYSGKYSAQPLLSERVIVPWGKDLALLTLPEADPAGNIELLRHSGADTFKRVRDDGTLGSEVRFERDSEKRVIGYLSWNYAYRKLDK